MNTTTTPTTPAFAAFAAFELRVLDGTQRGASTLVRSGAWDSDIVLRSAGLADSGVELVLAEGADKKSGSVDVIARQGQVHVGGVALPVGERVRVPLYTPILIGDTAVALGELGANGWAPLFANAGTAADAAAATPATAAAPIAARRPWPRWLVRTGGALAAVSLSMLALAVVVSPTPPAPEALAARAQAMLHAGGFAAVSVQAGAGGELVVSGYLDTEAQRAQAEQMLAAQGISARLAIWVNENLATAVREVYRLHGVHAEIEASGPGAVRVRTSAADGDALQQVQAIARRDVAGLSRLVATNQPPPIGPSAIPRVDDPGKRVASIVGGEAAHVVTVDGTRYFIGALLPTGHRIVAIAGRDVRLTREGQASSLTF
jgi:type III secretion protein D